MVYPWLAGLVAVKPTTGLAVLCAQRRWRHVVLAGSVAVALVVISFVVDPGWVTAWRATVRVSVEVPPVMRPFGALLLLAALRWRRPEARWLLVFAVVPITSPMYESLPLFMAPLTFRQTLVLALLSHAARWAMFLDVATEQTTAIVVLYLPALSLLLRRPNADDSPAEPVPTPAA